MLSASVSCIRAYGPSALAFMVIVMLAGVLVERRILTPRPAPEPAPLASVPLVSGNEPLPGLRRIVLDPCTGLEKGQLGALTAKAD